MTPMTVALSLSELADVINAEHKLVLEAGTQAQELLSDGLLHGIKAGEALLLARDQAPPNGWLKWVDDNIEFSYVWAQCYMRFAKYQDRLIGANTQLTTVSARQLLTGLPDVHIGGRVAKLDPQAKAEVKRLHKAGTPKTEIAALFQVGTNTIDRAIDPVGAKVKEQEYRRRVRLSRKALSEQQRRHEAERAVKASGLDRLYQDLRRLALSIDARCAEETDREVKTALRSAYNALVKAEEEIVRAGRISGGTR